MFVWMYLSVAVCKNKVNMSPLGHRTYLVWDWVSYSHWTVQLGSPLCQTSRLRSGVCCRLLGPSHCPLWPTRCRTGPRTWRWAPGPERGADWFRPAAGGVRRMRMRAAAGSLGGQWCLVGHRLYQLLLRTPPSASGAAPFGGCAAFYETWLCGFWTTPERGQSQQIM